MYLLTALYYSPLVLNACKHLVEMMVMEWGLKAIGKTKYYIRRENKTTTNYNYIMRC